ncbi:helicase associated domain-containing protein [Streptomyces sp. NPDC059970]|uniref:helicase associated domain-containing protein n=1 Tax=Streptomyces sp. NPDC059970 TaxID=3347019 RepID=UPI0036CA42B5
MKPRVYPASPGLTHARAYAQAHGHLGCSRDTRHDGFPLGDWLVQKRRAARQGRLATTTQALETLDPWWCPPWPYTWQRTYHQAREHHHTGQPHSPHSNAGPTRNAPAGPPSTPQQQHLLTNIGIHPA